MNVAMPLAEALRQAVAFEPAGEAAGNVTVGRGRLEGRSVHAAFVENRAASGSLGAKSGALACSENAPETP